MSDAGSYISGQCIIVDAGDTVYEGGRASAGSGPLLELVPAELHQRSSLIFGSRREVERLEQYHRDHNERDYDAPLFGTRGLFRASAEL